MVSSLVLFLDVIFDGLNSPDECFLVFNNVLSESFHLHNKLLLSLLNSLVLSHLQLLNFLSNVQIDFNDLGLSFCSDFDDGLRQTRLDLTLSDFELLNSNFNSL